MVGLMIGLLITSAQPSQAQWAVFDASNYAKHIEEMEKQMDRWQKQWDHYQKMYDKAVKMYDKAVEQVTSLGGILKTVDKQLARNKSLVSSIAKVGKMVRQIYQMKRQIESMVTSRIRAVRSLKSRLKAGIFNPHQDLLDLEDYLRNSIGRSSQDTIANSERLANMDNEFERIRYELQLAWGRMAEAEAVLKEYETQLEKEMEKPEEERHQAGFLQNQITQAKALIEQINTQINELTSKLVDKMRLYGNHIKVRADYGETVENETKAWESTVPARQDILKKIDEEFEPDPGIDDDPADGNN
jgi:chromosome segregation ATPase